jgi:hypothetical protein
MNQFIQSLESRTLFSVNLLADQAAILADSTSVKSDTAALTLQDKIDLAAITTDLKGLPKTTSKTNAALLKTVKTDVTILTSQTNTGQKSLLTTSSADAKKAVAAGNKLQSAFTTANENAVIKDSGALEVLVAPLGPIDLALGNLNTALTGPLITDLGLIGTANPTATQLASDIAALNAAYAASSAQLTADATQYQTTLTTLNDDLGVVENAIPNIMFTYQGTATNTTQGTKNFGKNEAVTLDVVQEDDSIGSWTGTLTATGSKGKKQVFGASGFVSNAGQFAATLSNGTTVTGVLNGSIIKGTEANTAGAKGTFSVRETGPST